MKDMLIKLEKKKKIDNSDEEDEEEEDGMGSDMGVDDAEITIWINII